MQPLCRGHVRQLTAPSALHLLSHLFAYSACGKGQKEPGSGVQFRRPMESCCPGAECCLCCPAVTMGWWLVTSSAQTWVLRPWFHPQCVPTPTGGLGSTFELGFSTPWALAPACEVKLPLGDFTIILILRESLLIRVGWYPCQIPQSLRNSQNRRRRIVICKEPHTLLPHHTLFISAEIPSPHFCSLHLSTVLSRSLWPQPPPNPNKKKPEQQQKKPNKITYNNYNLLF